MSQCVRGDRGAHGCGGAPTSSFQTCAHACVSMSSPLPPAPVRSRSRNWAVVRLRRILMVSSSFRYWLMRSGCAAARAGLGAMGDRRESQGRPGRAAVIAVRTFEDRDIVAG